MGISNINPVLDSGVYEVHILYGTIIDYKMNILIKPILITVK